MTRAELVALIKGRKWRKVPAYRSSADPDRFLRCAAGDCPIIAAHRIMFPDSVYGNASWPYAARDLALPVEEARRIVAEADGNLPLGPDLQELLT
jgi:hypothetical protein